MKTAYLVNGTCNECGYRQLTVRARTQILAGIKTVLFPSSLTCGVCDGGDSE